MRKIILALRGRDMAEEGRDVADTGRDAAENGRDVAEDGRPFYPHHTQIPPIWPKFAYHLLRP